MSAPIVGVRSESSPIHNVLSEVLTPPAFGLTHEYEPLLEKFRSFVDDELRPLEDEEVDVRAEHLPAGVVREVRARASASGFYAPDFATAIGGVDVPQTAMVMLREYAEACGCRLARHAIYGAEGPSRILLRATEQQRETYLVPLVRAEKTRSLALTEPDAGSDISTLATQARREGGSWILNGKKHLVSNASTADFFIVVAKTHTGERQSRHAASAFIVERGTRGMHLLRRQVGMYDDDLFEVEFRDCEVAADQLVGGASGEGAGLAAAITSFPIPRISIAAKCNGMAAYALSLGILRARTRESFGRLIGQHQYVQGHVVDCAVALQAARLLAYEAAFLVDSGADAIRASSMAKLLASESVSTIIDRMLQVHGGIGYTRDTPLERLYRYSRMFRIVEGTSEIQRWIISETFGL